MTAVLLALLSAVGYGASDFLAGVESRRLPYVRVAVVVQCVGAVVVLLALPFAGGRFLWPAVAWGGEWTRYRPRCSCPVSGAQPRPDECCRPHLRCRGDRDSRPRWLGPRGTPLRPHLGGCGACPARGVAHLAGSRPKARWARLQWHILTTRDLSRQISNPTPYWVCDHAGEGPPGDRSFHGDRVTVGQRHLQRLTSSPVRSVMLATSVGHPRRACGRCPVAARPASPRV